MASMRVVFVVAAGLALSAPATPASASFDCRIDWEQAQMTAVSGAADRPAWAHEGIPENVWMLVEAAAATDDQDEAKCLLAEAEAEARNHANRDGATVADRFAVAVVLGMRANTEGGRAKVEAASELYEVLVAILTDEPGHARARHLLGRLHAGVQRMGRLTRWVATNLLGGAVLKAATWEEAEINLSYAERAVPEVADHHLQLANLYRDTGRPDLALIEVEHVLALPADSPLVQGVRAEALSLAEQLRS